MKIIIALILLSSTAFAVSCGKGCEEWGGICACDAPKASSAEPEVNYASDEKPPRHPQPAWERGEVNIVNAPNLAVEDMKMDKEKAEADAEGKRNAKIRN